jgi:hypothetical protein
LKLLIALPKHRERSARRYFDFMPPRALAGDSPAGVAALSAAKNIASHRYLFLFVILTLSGAKGKNPCICFFLLKAQLHTLKE